MIFNCSVWTQDAFMLCWHYCHSQQVKKYCIVKTNGNIRQKITLRVILVFTLQPNTYLCHIYVYNVSRYHYWAKSLIEPRQCCVVIHQQSRVDRKWVTLAVWRFFNSRFSIIQLCFDKNSNLPMSEFSCRQPLKQCWYILNVNLHQVITVVIVREMEYMYIYM